MRTGADVSALAAGLQGLGLREAEVESLLESELEALFESAAIRSFTCTAADQAAIATLLAVPSISVPALRGAVRRAAGDAATWASRAADALDRTPRLPLIRRRFREAFATTPEFVPAWRPSSATWRDRGALTAIRLRNAARVLRGGSIRYFCYGRPAYCPECTDPPSTYYACSSWGAQYVICLGEESLRDWHAGRRVSLAATLLHEALHIYFGRLIEHGERERYGNVNCYVRFALRANGRPLPPRLLTRCPAA